MLSTWDKATQSQVGMGVGVGARDEIDPINNSFTSE